MNPSLPTVTELVASSGRFSQRAVESHDSKEFELFPLFSATAIEHITKACLLNRHPALLLPTQTRNYYEILLYLIGEESQKPPKFLTVGLKESLVRVRKFVASSANTNDLEQLIDLRDGSVHIAGSTEAESKLLVAFVQQVHSSLLDLKVDPSAFWGKYLGIVETLLTNEQSRIDTAVNIKIQKAKIRFDSKISEMQIETATSFVNEIPWTRIGLEKWQCPACNCQGLVFGAHHVQALYHPQGDVDLGIPELKVVSFIAHGFSCSKCELRLDSAEELISANIPVGWTSDADPDEVNQYNFEWIKNLPPGLDISHIIPPLQ